MRGLRTLLLRDLDALEEVPASVGGLKDMKRYDILKCGALSELPESIGLLRGLRTLSLGGLSELDKVQASVGGLTGLQELKNHG
jgi:hypothetical protein